MKTALFTGTFDPFTIGHADVVSRVLPLFDRVVIGVGVNERKQCRQTADKRVTAIRRVYADNPAVKVVAYDDLTVDLAHREQADVIVRGVRSVKDFEYEREQAEMNRRLSGIVTLLLPADPQFSSISSSILRELEHFGHDIKPFLP
ncbi:MAG: pantetheine-phosphate adenylyltransferase [Prevotella sp.]|nr:pantetheine-phosphate adenylyltransferase [Prevotella sp.]